MTRHPPQPLDAEERALAALLPRPHGRGEPGADLDARILAAAQAALHAQPAGRGPRRSWIGPTALAASLVLAVGLAWQLRPPPSLPASPATDAAASADSEAMSTRALEMPASMPDPATQKQPMPPPPEASASPQVRDASARIMAPAPVPVAPPPPAPPAPPAPVVAGEEAAVALPPTPQPARAPAPAMTKAGAGDAMREGAAASATNAAEKREQPPQAADAATDTFVGSESEDDVPPATADSPAVREAWLRRIGELLEQGKADEAKASLAEFKRRYPDAALPPELRKLEP